PSFVLPIHFGQDVVNLQAYGSQPFSVGAALDQGQQHFFGQHQMRCQPVDDRPFGSHLPYQPKIELFQVPKSPVDQFGGLPAGPRGEVPLFEQQGPYATGGGIQSDPRPGNASPDHDQIIGFPQNLLKGLLSVHI